MSIIWKHSCYSQDKRDWKVILKLTYSLNKYKFLIKSTVGGRKSLVNKIIKVKKKFWSESLAVVNVNDFIDFKDL